MLASFDPQQRKEGFMTTVAPSLMSIYERWDSNQLALVRAITGLSPEPLAWRSAAHLSSVGELILLVVSDSVKATGVK